MTSALETALLAYDGKQADLLKELRDEFVPTAAVLRQAVRLASHDNVFVAKGATWLLWTWLTNGAKPTPRIVVELAGQLPRLADMWVLLHVVRCVPLLVIEAKHAPAFARFLQRCCEGELPFLRAWAVDSLHRLSLDYAKFAAAARRAMEAAAIDPAPSVRKRLEKILQGR